MAVQDTSREAFELVRQACGPDEQTVFEILEEIGPAHDRRILEALNQKESFKPKNARRTWTINSVTGRRNGLVDKRFVFDIGSWRGQWYGAKKTYHFWRAAGDCRQPAGWQLVRTPGFTDAERREMVLKISNQREAEDTEKKIINNQPSTINHSLCGRLF